MITVRKADERGHLNFGWLDTYHTFSFGEYHDPKHMSFRSLRVINEDRIEPGKGFGTHPHRDMEIVTYVLEGALEHKDSMGNGSVIRSGEIQRMTAGTGVTHSEFNPSDRKPVHLLQIWIFPQEKDLAPGYEQKSAHVGKPENALHLIVSQEGGVDTVTIHQDARVYAARLGRHEEVQHTLRNDRHAWIQVARGNVTVNGIQLYSGDGAAASEEGSLTVTGTEQAEVLLFDLA